MMKVSPTGKPVPGNRGALVAVLQRDLSGTLRLGAGFGVLGLVAVLAGWTSMEQLIDAGRRELAYRVLLVFLGVAGIIGGLLCWWLAPRKTRRLVRSVESDERTPMLMSVERKVFGSGSDEVVHFVATLYSLSAHQLVLRDVRLRHGNNCLEYPYDEGVSKVPVDVYGRPGEGPVVIDAGWGFLLPSNRTYPYF
ncbi:hypothetical protein JKA73_18550 [Myxococcus xanthus]|uniref:hypothetical protein n=1 Tax=Myxococcus xanthus TaxID=34 RepID=UPI0019177E43|nr:hypothetical protein [Myxococcus xanthus]QQR47917.1 hypothetical protein JKA73_18550 [Myxococcus xanthus]